MILHSSLFTSPKAGSTHVNVDECIGSGSVGRAGAIGTITGNVYGGGNEAKVEGNTHVNIGTKLGQSIVFVSPVGATEAQRTKVVKGAKIRGNIYGGGNKAEVTGNTNVIIGR